ncbi:Mannose-6-phosphate isomerase, cupin superfamily [Roseomonas rosea]|uniref:Mannose-6-phosphate isomerase, cupin superfamily n=1 Tax=Muricoccus roseus TaxID=198092 RepID=A0A1M6JYB7_9PROT|nr:cupin domain-containing protein [Roseomonas rosea]SHJ51685.1 Mannose-6-phosphate isomerase, cupin superfamily [Roseomonas rosea]
MSDVIETLMSAARTADLPQPAQASVRVPLAPTGAEPGRMVHLLGMLVTFKATSAETGGAFSLSELAMNRGAGMPLHRHADTESFLILEGEVEFTIGRETLRRGEGDFIPIPADAPHGFRQVGGRLSRMLSISMPGRAQEGFFLDAGEPVAYWAVPPASSCNFSRVVSAGLRHGIVMLPPV